MVVLPTPEGPLITSSSPRRMGGASGELPESGIKDSGGSEDDVAGGSDDAPGSGEVGGSLEVGGKGGTMTESYRGVEGLSGVSTGHPQASGRF